MVYNLIKRYHLNFGRDIKILDAGCGMGIFLKNLKLLEFVMA